MERQLVQGGFYKHFKNKLYQVKGIAYHSETKEKMVVYQAMYGEYAMYVRPYDMFMSEVDHVKYPEVTQKYRFEHVDPLTMNEISDNSQTDSSQADNSVSGSSQAVGDASDDNVDKRYIFRVTKVYKPSEQTEQEQPEEPETAGDSILDKFLDARDYEEKLDVLVRYKSRFTDPMIDIMAESLEIVVPEGELSGRIESLRKVLQAHTKYEGSHLRP